jgi:hypothetical protein
MKRLTEKTQLGTVLKIKFKHHKDDTNKKNIKKIYLGDYEKLFKYLNRDSIFVEVFEDADLQVFDDYMILTLTNEIDEIDIEFVETRLKNTSIIGVAEVDSYY